MQLNCKLNMVADTQGTPMKKKLTFRYMIIAVLLHAITTESCLDLKEAPGPRDI